MLRSIAGIAALVFADVACTLPNTAGDAGATDAGSQTVGTQCDKIALAYCMHGINDCGVFETLSQCVSDQSIACCQASGCDAISRTPPAAVDACTSEIPSEDCNSVVNEGLSALSACQGIPQAP